MTFTKERLEQFINKPLEHGLTRGEKMEMARQLLAWMEQEPVAKAPELSKVIYHFRDWNEGFPVEKFKADYVISWMLANYPPAQPSAAPQLPQPAVPFGFTDGDAHGMVYEPRHADRLANPMPVYRLPPQPAVVPHPVSAVKGELAFIDHFERIIGERDGDIDIGQLGRGNYDALMLAALDAFRAAMLQGAEPVSQPYTLRDGWVAVPVEPTEEMNKAGWAAMNEHDAINPTYRAMLAAAPDFREISNSSTKHFRENEETSTKCPKCGGRGSYHCPQMLGTVECECTLTAAPQQQS